MVLHVEKTLKTNIQKKFPKSQKFAKKYLWWSFIIYFVQTIILWFIVILFHSNLDENIASKEQNVTSNEQKVTSNEQRAKSSASLSQENRITEDFTDI